MPQPASTVNQPLLVGVFSTVAQTDQAVRRLLEAGFSKNQLGVVCSTKHQDRLFPNVPKAPVPGAPSNYKGAIAAGGIAGATVGGLALAATTLATGGAALLAAGTVLVGGGAIAGAFSGAMATMGADDRVGDYCKEALLQGKILLVVHVPGENAKARMNSAEAIMLDAGAESVLAAPE